MPRVPSRTCIGCRQPAPAPELVRLGVLEGRVTVAAARGGRGRGAWLHPRVECVAAAVRTRAFARAFKAAVTAPEPGQLLASLQHSLQVRQTGYR